MERRDTTLQINGLNLHVIEWGRREASPIVMLHGIRGFAETFSGVANALMPDFRVIAFDQRGRGQSDWDPKRQYYTDAYVSDLLKVTEVLGIEHFDLLGHSMGGINAIVFASLYPEKVQRLIIEDAGPGAFEKSAGAERIRQELIRTPTWFPNWDEASLFMKELRPSVTEEARQQRLKSMLKQLPEGQFTWQYDHAGIVETRLNPDPKTIVDLAFHVSRIKSRTLVIRGANTDYLQPEMAAAMQKLNNKISVAEIDGAGHYVHDDQPLIFCAIVKEFLRNNE